MKKILIVCLTVCIAMGSMSGCAAIKQAMEKRAEEEKDLMRGSYDGDLYTSEFANLTFTAPDGWEYLSDKEISKLMDTGRDVLLDAKVGVNQEELKKRSLHDMMITNPNTRSSVTIMYEELMPDVDGTTSTEEEYLNNMIQILEAFKYTCSDISDATIASEKYKTFCAKFYDIPQYYYTRKMDKYMMNIIISVFGEDDIGDILDDFSLAETEE